MKYKDFQAPVLFSSTFKALNLKENIQGLSRMCEKPVSEVSGDSQEGSFIFEPLSVTIQPFNAALFHQSFTRHDDPDL